MIRLDELKVGQSLIMDGDIYFVNALKEDRIELRDGWFVHGANTNYVTMNAAFITPVSLNIYQRFQGHIGKMSKAGVFDHSTSAKFKQLFNDALNYATSLPTKDNSIYLEKKNDPRINEYAAKLGLIDKFVDDLISAKQDFETKIHSIINSV